MLNDAEMEAVCAAGVAGWNTRGRRILALIPDNTRTGPVDRVFKSLHRLLAGDAAAFDVLVALGTHPPMSEEGFLRRLGLTPDERRDTYGRVQFFNHHWNDPAHLTLLGHIEEDEVFALSGGLMRERVPVSINRLVTSYDVLLVIGPTFPHEVVGFSGGNKYVFPGISGPEIIDFFHWLGALITNPGIIGHAHTPVRAVVDKAAAMVPIERLCASLVVEHGELAGLYLGTPEEAWRQAAAHSAKLHVVYHQKPYRRVLSVAPAMYDELWVGGKCAYKLEPVVADGGELVIYAPHLDQISVTHGKLITAIGYHVRDFFTKQWKTYEHVPRGILAHSTHVKGVGRYEGGIEEPRITVTLATGLPEEVCRAINLGYRDWRSIDVEGWRADPDTLHVPKAGEILHRLAG